MRLVVLAAIAACGGSGNPRPSGPIDATITHYDYKLDLDSRAAHASVTATVNTGGDCWSLPFRAQEPANVTLDGEPAVSFTVDGGRLTACGAGYTEGATLVLEADVTFAIATLGTSQVGYSVRQDAQQNPFYYLVSWVNGCDQFAPCDNRPGLFATYHFDVTHPAGYVVRCPGGIVEDSPTETECGFDFEGGPTYSTFGVAAYPAWTQTDLGMWGDVRVTLYDRAQTGIAARINSAWHAGYVAWLESSFGPYPYGHDLRLLTAPTYWNGFEHPGNILLSDTLAIQTMSGYADPVQHVIDHEVTHMWAGDQTTIAGTYDFVWKESMAEYLAYVYEDTQNPATAATTARAWKAFAASARYFPVPLDHPDLFAYYGDVYGPGPMVLFRQLEVMSSRAQVVAAIRSVLGQPRALAVSDLEDALQRETGLDVSQYALAWIDGSGAPAWPRFHLQLTPGTGTSTLLLHQVNPGSRARGCKFHVALQGANAGEVALVAVDTVAGGADQTLQIPTPPFAVTSLQLDPGSECLVYLDSSSPFIAPAPAWIAPANEWLSQTSCRESPQWRAASEHAARLARALVRDPRTVPCFGRSTASNRSSCRSGYAYRTCRDRRAALSGGRASTRGAWAEAPTMSCGAILESG
jgi:aminopeptidase N